jgi:2-hydroxychromene-2-carboxylate isomerase
MKASASASSPGPLFWYFDVISPFAALAVPEIAALAQSHPIAFRPVLFAGLLKAHGHLGPAEIPAKRIQTYRMAQWLAQERGTVFRCPPAHPFNPLQVLRLLCVRELAAADLSAAFDLIWGEGRDPESAETGQRLADMLGITPDAAQEQPAKDRLRANTDAALAAGIYGVPTLRIGSELFWGLDALPMARAFLADPALFTSGEMARVSNLPMATERRR